MYTLSLDLTLLPPSIMALRSADPLAPQHRVSYSVTFITLYNNHSTHQQMMFQKFYIPQDMLLTSANYYNNLRAADQSSSLPLDNNASHQRTL